MESPNSTVAHTERPSRSTRQTWRSITWENDLKILFQGGWKAGRNADGDQALMTEYCVALARRVVKSTHSILLTSDRDADLLLADAINTAARGEGSEVKQSVTFLLPSRYKVPPPIGRVVRVPQSAWWIEERTYFVRECDAVIAIGGGRGSLDCVEKAMLAQKPIFVARSVSSPAARVWDAHSRTLRYLEGDEANVLNDVNLSPHEWVSRVFEILDRLAASQYSRRVFVVHGRNHTRRDQLAALLRKLKFEPVILEEQRSGSLTILEKLERETQRIGFAFVLYDADDVGGLLGRPPAPRARQNVVFEHGLLIGLLDRERTCAILAEGVEVPSDIHGMLYETLLDIAHSELRIATVLKQAGYEVPLDGLIG